MRNLFLIGCALLLLTSCASVQDYSSDRAFIRGEYEASRPANLGVQQPAPVEPLAELPDGTDYNRERLTIEPMGMSADIWSSGPFVGTGSGMTWRKWLAYKGFSQVSEPEFFRLTGYPDEAEKAQGHYKAAIGEMIGGGLLAVVGCIFLAGGYGDSPVDWTQVDIGYLAGIVGVALTWDGSVRMDHNWAPFGLVNGIAEQYNERLLR